PSRARYLPGYWQRPCLLGGLYVSLLSCGPGGLLVRLQLDGRSGSWCRGFEQLPSHDVQGGCPEPRRRFAADEANHYSIAAGESTCLRDASPAVCRTMADRKTGCLPAFLFVALCLSMF